MLLEKVYVIDGIKLQENIIYDCKRMLYDYVTYVLASVCQFTQKKS